MGLDLIHARLSIKDEHTPEFFTLDEFDGSPGFVERHSHLITEVVDVESIFTVYLFSDEKEKREYERWPGENETSVFLVGGLDNMKEEIAKIESDRGLEGMHKFMKEYKGRNITEKGPIVIEYAETYTDVPVIYWKEIGHQRKGMERAFYEAFENCKLYFKKEDVLKAYTYLSADYSEHYVRTFKEDFIDNFIEGESIFVASW